jgi:Rad3-related DNA helicase
MVWGLYSNGTALGPRTFSAGKTKEMVIDEIIEEFESHRVVFLKGGVGSGKSIIAATVSGALGKGIINVPVKPLQEQYRRDYQERLQIRVGDEDLKINMLMGRDNFSCPYVRKNVTCSYRSLPCVRPLSSGTPRWKIARECPYWSPIYPNIIQPLLKRTKCKVKDYESIGGTQHIHQRKEGCGYYDQQDAYHDSDILIYNNAKWQSDTILGKKPMADIEVFDEADLFLDGLTLRTSITQRTFSFLKRDAEATEDDEIIRLLEEVVDSFTNLVSGKEFNTPYDYDQNLDRVLKELTFFLKVLDSEFADRLMMRLDNVLTYKEKTNYYLEEGKLTFFIPEPSIVLRDFMERSSGRLLFMSATLQEVGVLGEIFGFDDFAFVEGETKMPGNLYVKRTGSEREVVWKSWQGPDFKTHYWDTLTKVLRRAERPTLVQVHSYQYLPEDGEHPLIPNRDSVKDMDQEAEIASFRQGDGEILYSTKTDRGIDLPGATCRGIVIMKYPFPSLKDPLFTVMKKKLGDRSFWMYYRDIAKRDFKQQVGRGLRDEDDWVELWSPDLKVLTEARSL